MMTDNSRLNVFNFITEKPIHRIASGSLTASSC